MSASPHAWDRWRATIATTFHRLAEAWRVVIYGFDGSQWNAVNVDDTGNVSTSLQSEAPVFGDAPTHAVQVGGNSRSNSGYVPGGGGDPSVLQIQPILVDEPGRVYVTGTMAKDIGVVIDGELEEGFEAMWGYESTVGPSPSAGHWRTDNASVILATTLYVADFDLEAETHGNVFNLIAAGDEFVLADNVDRGDFFRWRFTGVCTYNAGGDYWECPVELLSAGQDVTPSSIRRWEAIWHKKSLSHDADGNLKVNVVTGGSSGVQYTEGTDVVAGGEGTLVLAEDAADSSKGKALQLDSSGNLNVNVQAGATSGTQYTEGDTDASITGTAIMWEDAADTLASVSSSKPLPVNVVAGGTSGGATEAKQDVLIAEQAAQGLSLDAIVADTATLAAVDYATQTTLASLEGIAEVGLVAYSSGATKGVIALGVRNDTPTSLTGADGQQAPLVTDAYGRLRLAAENNAIRLSANLISGQTGVAGDSGTVGANTQRVVLATDVGLPAGSSILGVIETRPSVNQVYYAGVAKTVSTAFVNATASGNTSVVSAPGASTKIVVLDTFLVNQGAAVVAVKFQSATTDKTPTIDLSADGGGGRAFLQFECGTNEALNVNLGAAGTVGVMVRYITAAA